jgi:lambda family phage portal protein
MPAIEPRPKIRIAQNFLDKAIGYISPVRAAQRMRARAVMAMAGAYIGASRSRRATKEWTVSKGDADSDIIFDLPLLRERSRDLERNAPLAAGAINVTVSNAVGTGLKLQSRIDREYLGMTDDEADAWEENTEREFRLWADTQECDVSRTLRFSELQELSFRQSLVNGDSFTALPKIKRSGSPYALKLMSIEADRVCNEKWKPDTAELVAGIAKDQYGAPTAYHVINQNPYGAYIRAKDGYVWQIIPAFGSNTGLRNMIHLFRTTRPGQTRGVPFIAPVIEQIKQIDRYTEAEIMAAVISSMFTVFIESESGDVNFDISGLGEETGAATSDKDIKLGNGSVVGLSTGDKISTANPGRPNSAFDPFVKAILEQMGTALEIPFEVLIRHYQSSYSASRAALLEAWRFFKGRRVWMASNWCQPIYEIWLYEAIANGRIAAPGYFSDPMIKKAYSGAIWVGDSPGYIDPSKDIDSAQKRIDLGISTLDEETALITGGDFEKNLPRIRKERKIMQEIGLWTPAQSKNAVPVAPAPQTPQNQPGGQTDEAA